MSRTVDVLTADVDTALKAIDLARAAARATVWGLAGEHAPDHGAAGTGEPLQVLLRPGNAGSNTAADHLAVVKAALKQLPGYQPGTRPGRKVLVRVDGAGSTHAFLGWLTGQRLSYSVGFGLPDSTPELLTKNP